MIAALLLQMTQELTAPDEGTLFGIASCMKALVGKQLEQGKLEADGWIRVSTDAEEEKGVRTFGHRTIKAVLWTTRPANGDETPGCVVASEGSYASLISAINGKYGQPDDLPQPAYRWRVANYELFLVGVDVAGRDRGVVVSLQAGDKQGRSNGN